MRVRSGDACLRASLPSSHCSVGGVADAMVRLQPVAGLTRLRALGLRGVQLADGDGALLGQFTLLTSLDLNCTLLADEDVQQLAALSNLERLDVSYTRARAPPPLPSLTELAMDLCEVRAEQTRCCPS